MTVAKSKRVESLQIFQIILVFIFVIKVFKNSLYCVPKKIFLFFVILSYHAVTKNYQKFSFLERLCFN